MTISNYAYKPGRISIGRTSFKASWQSDGNSLKFSGTASPKQINRLLARLNDEANVTVWRGSKKVLTGRAFFDLQFAAGRITGEARWVGPVLFHQ